MKYDTSYFLDIILDWFDICKFDKNEISIIYQDLIEVVNYHNKRYYIESNPLISDYQYDLIFDLLKKFEYFYPNIISNSSPTQKLTYQIQTTFKQLDHKVPLLSLNNSYSKDDLMDWDNYIKKILQKNSIENVDYVIEPKFDWVSVELVYINWYLSQWITRWDWYVWEDVTENIKAISTIPKVLYSNKVIKELRVRWEILLPISKLNSLNSLRKKEWKQLFANTRNAASWTIRNLNPNIVKERWLICYVYDVLYLDWGDFSNISSYIEMGNILQSYWFLTSINLLWKLNCIEKVMEHCNEDFIERNYNLSDLEFDGLVIKVDDLYSRKILWTTNHHPRWAIAYKFPWKQVVTKLLDVIVWIWKNWTLTPTAKLQTVNLSWVNISSASLHNYEFIVQKDIRIWDRVWIKRSWEVIPYVISSITEERDWSEKIIYPPLICPYCWYDTIKLHDEIAYYCWNINCIWIIKEKLIFFVSKEAFDIDWLWDKLITLLVDNWLLKTFDDIFKLETPEKKYKLSTLPSMWNKRINDLLKQITLSKNIEIRRFINSLWIKYVWIKTSKIIESKFLEICSEINITNLEEFIKNSENLKDIYWIWVKTIESITKFFNQAENISILNNLEKVWIKLVKKRIWYNCPLDWKHFSVTWKFDVKRDDIVKIIESYGWIFDNSITTKTDFLISGQEPWSKYKNAKEIWIKIYYWLDQFQNDFNFINISIYSNKTPKTTSLF